MTAKRASTGLDDGAGWLGYTFHDPQLLLQALTHGSSPKSRANYQRLEFLGDRVLGLVIAEALFLKHGKETEGGLSARHSALVRGDECAEVGERLGLAEKLQVGVVERKKGVQRMHSVLGDVVEAVIGAIYVDGGLEVARDFVLHHWEKALKDPQIATKDPKTFVQEWALARGKDLPSYEVLKRSGPDHNPEFVVKLTVPKSGEAMGTGTSKQAAEKAAAVAFIAERNLR